MDNNQNLNDRQDDVTVEAKPENNTAPETDVEHTAAPVQEAVSESAPEGEAPAEPAPQSVGTGTVPDFSRYQTTASSSFASVPQEKIYINNTTAAPVSQKKERKPKARLGLGSAAAVVLVCMLFSGGAAFAGSYLANNMNGGNSPASGTAGNSAATPSIVLQAYTNPNKTEGTYDQVANAVAPTVVEITTESIVTDSYMWGGNYVTSGAGSGVIISADGLIITNNHVVSGANTIIVTTKDGTKYTAEVIGADADTDIAVIRIAAENLPFALIGNSDTLNVGQEVLALGNPLGNLGGTVTNGIISATTREVDIDGTTMTLIQTNAEVNPGNSGGGLFNLYGELIGIVNAKSTTSSSGVSVEGIGFAIPINTATNVASELVNYGYVRGRVMIGINYEDIDDSWEAMMYRVSALGVYVTASIHDELKAGDRIVAIDGTEVTYSYDIKAAIKDRKVGDEVTIKVVRGGKYYDVKITLTEYVPSNVSEKNTTDSESFENNFGK